MSNILKIAAAGAFAAEETDPNFNQTVLLLHGDGTNGAQNNTFLDSSTNNFTITRAGNTTQGTFSPFSTQDGGWSNYFDGVSNQQVIVAGGTDLDLGAGDFTVECWAYFSSLPSGVVLFGQIDDGNGRDGVAFGINSSSAALWLIGNGSAWVFQRTPSYTLTLNKWTHFAVSRISGTAYYFIDGVQIDSIANTTTLSQDALDRTYIGGVPQSGFDLHGYISNCSALKGTGINFASTGVPTSPLSTSTTNQKLLTCYGNRFADFNTATTAKTITLSGSPKVTPFSPFAPTAAYDASVNGGSGYFDGTGDYLDVASNAAFGYGTGDFTIDFWVYRVDSASASAMYLDQRTGSTTVAPIIFTDSGNLYYRVGGTNVINGSMSGLHIGAWSHIAVCRSGTSTKLFFNGNQIGSTYTDNNNYVTSPVRIGANYLAGSLPVAYLSNFRIVKGTALYTSNFTPPTSLATAVSGTSLLCNFTNAGIFDNTGKNNLETVGNCQIDGTTKKFGTGSVELDGSGDYLKFPITPEYTIGASENFTVECWFYRTSAAALVDLFSLNSAATGYAAVQIQATTSRTITLNVSQTGSAWAINSTSATTHNLNEWNHLAVVRSGGNTFNVYLNGTSIIGPTTNANALYSAGAYNIIGGRTNGAYFVGLIDDFRYTKGVARYTTTFTPPTKAFPDL